MKFNNKKGQAAMEFLMTYGWAILAAIVVIAVLAIYFRPSSIVSNSAIISAPFYANAFVADADNATNGDVITLEIRNNGGEDLDFVSADIALTQPSVIDCTPDTVSSPVTPIEAGSLFTVDVICTGLGNGDSISGVITVTYGRTGSGLDLTSTGSISGRAV